MPRGALHTRVIWFIVAATFVAGVAADSGTIGRYVYPDGRVVYSDKPVPGATLEKEIKIDTGTGAQTPPADEVATVAERPATAAFPAEASPGEDELGPIIAEARDGNCYIGIQGEGQVFAVNVEGLVPGESLDLTSTSDGETIRWTANASEDGTYGHVLFPAVAGKSSGKDTYTLRGSRCQLSVTFPWHL